jgi:class 3 adenylate cyclase
MSRPHARSRGRQAARGLPSCVVGGPLEEGAGRPPVRVTDAEREAMVARLQRACGEGRLNLDEFSERVGLAFEARTATDLELLTTDLPVLEAPPTPTTTPLRRQTSWVVGIMSGSDHRGRWHPAPTTNVLALMGGCTLDLRAAEIEGSELVINAVAIMGGIDVIVPEGIQVEMTGLAIFGGKDCRVKDVQPVPGSPVVRVRVFALMGGVTVRTPKSRRDRRDPHRSFHGHHPRHRSTPEERSDRFATEAGEAVSELRSMPVDGTVTVLFTDVEDFTGFSERLGDIEASHRLRDHQALVRREVDAHGGVEVTCQGDGFMVAFDGARRALRAAVAIQRAVEVEGGGMRVRMGLHTGEAIREDEDLFGRTVIVAARIAATASGGEILVSSLLRQLSDGSGEFAFGPARPEALKGLPGLHELHPVAWREPLVP